MRNKILFALSALGVIAGLAFAYFFSRETKPLEPVFAPVPNPYSQGIYAEGIVESDQPSGTNVNVYPEVSGPVTRILVAEGQLVSRGTPLLIIDSTVQQATVEQLQAQAEAAKSLLAELKAQPRREVLAVAEAQTAAAEATLRQHEDQLEKQLSTAAIDHRSVSKDTLDNARHAVLVATANLEVARQQRDLTKAGAWVYDIRNQERQCLALTKQAQAAAAVLDKYTIRAPIDGVVLTVAPALGSYVSPQGTYSTYTQGSSPVVVMSNSPGSLAVRVFVDEVLIPQMPPPNRIHAQMSIRGSGLRVPLHFQRVQPYVTPKIELSDQRTERVDLRVLPVVFRFDPPSSVHLYPGQLVDVYIGGD